MACRMLQAPGPESFDCTKLCKAGKKLARGIKRSPGPLQLTVLVVTDHLPVHVAFPLLQMTPSLKMPNVSQEEEDKARNFIAEVREDNGGITTEDRDFLLANRPSALRALQKTRRKLANSIKIVVDNLYSKETRFLFELIQNAEDNSYSIATSSGAGPYLSFKLHRGEIVVDSNENGFSEDNIRAICSVGDSTKTLNGGYIGEKGIGFKSVFKVAKRVHVQSGPFSFAFLHERANDDDGLGMITPFYEQPEELPSGVRTRITLTLLEPSKFRERSAEFQAVPDTFLMFLNRLQRLSIGICTTESGPSTTHYAKMESKDHGLYTTVLKKTFCEGKHESSSEQKYYTMKSNVHNLPFDEARKDKQGNSIDWTTVVLAFPVDDRDQPILQQQHTYAFLPLRRVGFTFLIQADFVTQANREDVVHSGRNKAVLKGVAEAFATVMAEFCKKPSLRYTWMRYLPGEFIKDEFWGTLWTVVRVKLAATALLNSWSGNGLYIPSALRKLPTEFIDNDGNPLLPDLADVQTYLSPSYKTEDFQILKRLGTEVLGWSQMVERLAADLNRGSGSKWKDMDQNGDWRSQICNLLSKIFSLNQRATQERLRKFPLIPLRDDRWVSGAFAMGSSTRVYFPYTDGICIPTDLGYNLVRTEAAENVAWTDLLMTLGVESCAEESVISSIIARYDRLNIGKLELSNAVAHVEYLYWFLPDQSSFPPQVRLVNHHGSLLKKGQYLYFPDEEDDYSPAALFKQDDGLSGHAVHYLHGDYLKANDPTLVHNGRAWRMWLHEMAGVRRIPELCAIDSAALSKEFHYIIDHRSNMLLGTLKRGWLQYRDQIEPLKDELGESLVLLENGDRDALDFTFLPLPKLKNPAMELGVAEAFSFVAVAEPLQNEDTHDWTFTKQLLGGLEEDLGFYLSVLLTFIQVNPDLRCTTDIEKIAKIYRNIQSRCGEDLEYIRRIFKHPRIWIPNPIRKDSTWLSAEHCVWDGPQWLVSKQTLKVETYLEFELFFKLTLQIPDVSQQDVTRDLILLKRCGTDNLAHNDNDSSETQSDIEDTESPFEVTIDNDFNVTDQLQSITAMDKYRAESFEELRLASYERQKRRSSDETSTYRPTQFCDLSLKEVKEEAAMRYEYLWRNLSGGDQRKKRDALRFSFEDSALVYVPTKRAWYAPSQCVWVESNVEIPEKVSIADAYPQKKTFFTSVLNVSEPTVDMYIKALAAGADGQTSVEKTKKTMALVCRMGLGETDISSLVEAKVFPIKNAHELTGFASISSADFAIVDSVIHWDAFKRRITVLDFSLEDIRDTKPLLQAMGLEQRLSSKLVQEVTVVNGGFKEHEMTSNLRSKSGPIVRCAFHFASPDKRHDVSTLYRKFKNATVYVSDGIKRSLQMTQDGRRIEGASSRANFHFEEVEGALRLYLPKDEVERDVCFESDLPRRLCIFLNITDPGASGVIGGVFRKDNPAVIDKILENAGVGRVECDFDVLDEELEETGARSDVETLVEATHDLGLSVQPQQDRRSRSPVGNDLHNVRLPILTHQERQKDTQETAYQHVLENTVKVARHRARYGPFESTGRASPPFVAVTALDSNTIQEAFSGRSLERDFKVGAAGELYMYEYLNGLHLPSFNLANWKSSIRDRVKIHPDYHDLTNVYDRGAIADIEYIDESRRLTDFLTMKGHLKSHLSDQEKPLYHIEVKATTSADWQEPFFMSRAQEQHIRDKQIKSDQDPSHIYLICRVFNLGKGDETGVHIYLDPETKRSKKELDFYAHTWAVKPLIHSTIAGGNSRIGASASPTSATVVRDAGPRENDAKSTLDAKSPIPSDTSDQSSDSPESDDASLGLAHASQSSGAPLGGNAPIEGRSELSSTAGSVRNSNHTPPGGNGRASQAISPPPFGSTPAATGKYTSFGQPQKTSTGATASQALFPSSPPPSSTFAPFSNLKGTSSGTVVPQDVFGSHTATSDPTAPFGRPASSASASEPAPELWDEGEGTFSRASAAQVAKRQFLTPHSRKKE